MTKEQIAKLKVNVNALMHARKEYLRDGKPPDHPKIKAQEFWIAKNINEMFDEIPKKK
jgi:hypothetical protein